MFYAASCFFSDCYPDTHSHSDANSQLKTYSCTAAAPGTGAASKSDTSHLSGRIINGSNL
jgi:hypothetical protein